MKNGTNLKACIACNSPDLIRKVRVLDFTNGTRDQHVGKDRKPSALVFKGTEVTTVSAVVCKSCGFIHHFATDPNKLEFTL